MPLGGRRETAEYRCFRMGGWGNGEEGGWILVVEGDGMVLEAKAFEGMLMDRGRYINKFGYKIVEVRK